MTNNKKINDIAGMYSTAFKENGRTPAAVFCPKGRQELRYSKMLSGLDLVNKSILDFGCGLAHLNEFIHLNDLEMTYSGVDVCNEFLVDNRARFPRSNFLSGIEFDESTESYDIIISVGTYNLVYFDDPKDNWAYIEESLKNLWSKCKYALVLNWMTDLVDFQQDKAFHLSPKKLIDFGTNNLSKRYLIDQSYMPYEYHGVFFKDSTINRQDNTYGEAFN